MKSPTDSEYMECSSGDDYVPDFVNNDDMSGIPMLVSDSDSWEESSSEDEDLPIAKLGVHGSKPPAIDTFSNPVLHDLFQSTEHIQTTPNPRRRNQTHTQQRSKSSKKVKVLQDTEGTDWCTCPRLHNVTCLDQVMYTVTHSFACLISSASVCPISYQWHKCALEDKTLAPATVMERNNFLRSNSVVWVSLMSRNM